MPAPVPGQGHALHLTVIEDAVHESGAVRRPPEGVVLLKHLLLAHPVRDTVVDDPILARCCQLLVRGLGGVSEGRVSGFIATEAGFYR